MEDRKKEAVSQRHTVRNLGLLCSTMSMVILAGGVAMMNNYQKMQEMETVLGFCASGGGKALGSGQRRAGGERTGDCGGD